MRNINLAYKYQVWIKEIEYNKNYYYSIDFNII